MPGEAKPGHRRLPQTPGHRSRAAASVAMPVFRCSLAAVPARPKNHADVPAHIRQETGRGDPLLISHLTPPISATARHNVRRNHAEVALAGLAWKGKATWWMTPARPGGGLPVGAVVRHRRRSNADPQIGDGDRTAIQGSVMTMLVNQAVTSGRPIPVSQGGPECPPASRISKRNNNRPTPERITSSSGLQLDRMRCLPPTLTRSSCSVGQLSPAFHHPLWRRQARHRQGSAWITAWVGRRRARLTGSRVKGCLCPGVLQIWCAGAIPALRLAVQIGLHTPRPLDEHPFEIVKPWFLWNNSAVISLF